jgi:hypothetical protein
MRAAVIYTLAVLSAQFTATMFIPFPVFGAVAVGTILFGVTFTQRDRMHRHGRPFVYKIIFLAAFLSLGLLLSIRFGLGAALAAYARGQLGGGFGAWLAESWEMLADSSWRVFLASTLAIIIAESTDTEVYHRFLHQRWILRVLRSNAVSIPVDSILFNLIAFAGVFSNLLLVQIIFGEIVVKATVSVIYALVRKPPEEGEPEPRGSVGD